MKIRIGDLKVTQEHRDMINEILDSGRFTEGSKVKELEQKFADYLGVKHAILVTNGTVSLQLLGQMLLLSRGKLKVAVPALTFPATINAFLVVGHTVRLVDVKEDLQIDPELIPLDSDVVVPVHLMGYTADMTNIMKKANLASMIVIEDAAEAFGAEHKGQKVGTFGDFGSFSFYVSHNIWAGEMGLITTNSDVAAKKLRSMKNHGRTGDNLKFLHSYVGSNYKITEFVAGMGLVNMSHVDEILKTRFDNAKYFHDNIKNDKLTPYPVPEGFSPLGYPIKCRNESDKRKIVTLLVESGVETRDMFPCLANQDAYHGKFDSSKYPVANKLEKTMFYIGVHQYLTEEDKKKVVEVLNSF